jgi:hypothetical protein
LQLLGDRYYDPTLGRFLTRDIAKDGRNWYVYCGNNPLKYADPEGTDLAAVLKLCAGIALADGPEPGPADGVAVVVGVGVGIVTGAVALWKFWVHPVDRLDPYKMGHKQGKSKRTSDKHWKGERRQDRDQGPTKNKEPNTRMRPQKENTGPGQDKGIPRNRRPGYKKDLLPPQWPPRREI